MPVIEVHRDTEALTLTFVAEFAANAEVKEAIDG